MATIRKRRNKWQVQIRRLGFTPTLKVISRSKGRRSWGEIHGSVSRPSRGQANLGEAGTGSDPQSVRGREKRMGLPIRTNPLGKFNFRCVDQRRERRLNPGELDRIIEAARQCRNPLIAPIVLVALETGMRRSEILATRKDKIDFANKALLIENTENGRTWTIPLTNKAIALLREIRGETNHLFPITANAFRLAWERVQASGRSLS